MGKSRGGADDRIYIGVIDQIRAVVVHSCTDGITHLMCAFDKNVGYSNDLTAGKLIGNAVNVFTADRAASHNADS